MYDILTSPLFSGIGTVVTILSATVTVIQWYRKRIQVAAQSQPQRARITFPSLPQQQSFFARPSMLLAVTLLSALLTAYSIRPNSKVLFQRWRSSETQVLSGEAQPVNKTPITDITVVNSLAVPVKITVGSDYQGTITPNGRITLPTQQSVAVDIELQQTQNTAGNPLGDYLRFTYPEVRPGSVLTITNNFGDYQIFSPVITNKLGRDCNVIINEGRETESRPKAYIPAGAENIGLGYYRLYGNSNVVLFCSGYEHWFGIRDSDPNSRSFATEINDKNGTIVFIAQQR